MNAILDITENILQRSANFTLQEQHLLRDLVKKYKNLLISKKTRQISSKVRDQIWHQIGVEFNKHPHIECTRTVAQLKNKWDYMKRVARKEAATLRKVHMDIEGGPPPTPLIKTTKFLTETVKKPVEEIPSHFDSDREKVKDVTTPHYTRSKFLELAEKKIEYMDEKAITKKKLEAQEKEKSLLEKKLLEEKTALIAVEKEKTLIELEIKKEELHIIKLKRRKLEADLGTDMVSFTTTNPDVQDP